MFKLLITLFLISSAFSQEQHTNYIQDTLDLGKDAAFFRSCEVITKNPEYNGVANILSAINNRENKLQCLTSANKEMGSVAAKIIAYSQISNKNIENDIDNIVHACLLFDVLNVGVKVEDCKIHPDEFKTAMKGIEHFADLYNGNLDELALN